MLKHNLLPHQGSKPVDGDFPLSTLHQVQTGPWSARDDEVLVQARTISMGWAQIQGKHFPTKTAKACRLRYERLLIKRSGLPREGIKSVEGKYTPEELSDSGTEYTESHDEGLYHPVITRSLPRRDSSGLFPCNHSGCQSLNPTAFRTICEWK